MNCNALMACEEMRSSLLITDHNCPAVCPKPRRVGVLNLLVRPLRLHLSQHAEGSDSKAEAELHDIIIKKESYGEEFENRVASSPPYFCGSPPVRAANPLIQDDRFGDKKHTPISASPLSLVSPSSASHRGGCTRMKFGLKPAAVRVEGFDCLSRDHQNSSITSFA